MQASLARWSRPVLRPVLRPVVLLVLLLAGVLAAPGAALAASASYGHLGPSYGSAVTHPPTSDKPQSKLWFNDGSWWATMWVSGKGWHIERLDRTSESWVDTGVLVDSRATTLTDTLWDGHHLFVAAAVSTVSTEDAPNPSKTGQPAKLYRYTYANGTYTLDSGFPTTINTLSSEDLTIDEDSTGALWATWVEIDGNATAGYTATVYVADSSVGGTSWATPFVVPVGDAHPSVDDISAVVAFGATKIGVMWSDQLTGTVYFAVHRDGTPAAAASSWTVVKAVSGADQADDHMNLKSLQADSAGRVVAAVKTSLDLNSGPDSQDGIRLLVYTPSTGTFTKTTVYTLGDCQTRPQVVLDATDDVVHVFTAGPPTSVTGCPHSGTDGAIYEKSASLDDPVFTPGRPTPVIQDGSSANVNNVTTTKQSVTSATGLVVLASNDATKRYWFSDESLGSPPAPAAPVASFSESPTSGAAPLPVSFTDTSTGSPTSWAWSFGDGSTSTSQSPSHTYTAAGSYPVSLTVTGAGGSSTTSQVVTVSAPPAATGTVTAGASTSATSTSAVKAVGLTEPSGVVPGDVLVASITADGKPAVSSVPAGWSPAVTSGLSPNGDASTFVYYHVVSGAASEPASWSFGLSTAEKWNAGVGDFHGVDASTPFDTAAVTHVNTGSSTSASLAGVTTLTPGAMVVGGVGLNSASATVTAPSGWSEAWEGDGAQTSEMAYQARPVAGATGKATWTLSASVTSAGWMTALRPATS